MEWYNRLSKTPEGIKLIESSKMWYVPIVLDMALTHSERDILSTLEKKADGRKVPAKNTLSKLIRKEAPRTREQMRAILSKKKRKYSRNNLSDTQIAQLIAWGVEYFESSSLSRKYSDAIRESMIQSTIRDSYYFQISPDVNDNILREKWLQHLRRMKRYYFFSALRNQSRVGKKYPLENNQFSSRPAVTDETTIRFARPLTKKEKIVFGLLREGKTPAQIARIMGLSFQTVNYHRKMIGEKIIR